jgi:hypothetical protein
MRLRRYFPPLYGGIVIRMRTKSVQHLHPPPRLGRRESAMEFGSPVPVVPPPTGMPPSYSFTTVIAPLPEHEFVLELGVIGGAFANGKGVEYECGES